MAQEKALASKILRFIVRGAVLGASLGAIFPLQSAKACDCHDWGSGKLSVLVGNGENWHKKAHQLAGEILSGYFHGSGITGTRLATR